MFRHNNGGETIIDNIGERRAMVKRCKKCKVPLEGFMYKLIASKIFGIRPSVKNPELCNKCEDKKE